MKISSSDCPLCQALIEQARRIREVEDIAEKNNWMLNWTREPYRPAKCPNCGRDISEQDVRYTGEELRER